MRILLTTVLLLASSFSFSSNGSIEYATEFKKAGLYDLSDSLCVEILQTTDASDSLKVEACLLLAEISIRKRNGDASDDFMHLARKYAAKDGFLLARCNMYSACIDLYTSSETDSVLNQMRDLKARYPSLALSYYNNLSVFMIRASRFTRAIDAVENGLSYAQKTNDSNAIATLYLNKAIINRLGFNSDTLIAMEALKFTNSDQLMSSIYNELIKEFVIFNEPHRAEHYLLLYNEAQSRIHLNSNSLVSDFYRDKLKNKTIAMQRKLLWFVSSSALVVISLLVLLLIYHRKNGKLWKDRTHLFVRGVLTGAVDEDDRLHYNSLLKIKRDYGRIMTDNDRMMFSEALLHYRSKHAVGLALSQEQSTFLADAVLRITEASEKYGARVRSHVPMELYNSIDTAQETVAVCTQLIKLLNADTKSTVDVILNHEDGESVIEFHLNGEKPLPKTKSFLDDIIGAAKVNWSSLNSNTILELRLS